MVKHSRVKIREADIFDFVPNYQKYFNREIKDPETRAKVDALPGNPKINKAKFFMTLDWLLSLLKKEINKIN